MRPMMTIRWHVSLVAAAIWCGGALYAAGPTPTPTPTPRPSGGQSLNEVAKDKQLKGTGKGTSIVITNENLSEYADKGGLTTAKEKEAGKGSRRPVRGDATDSSVTVLGPTDPLHMDERQRYWVGQYQNQINMVTSVKRQIAVLDAEIPGLWNDFFARDDPAYRDGVIKPKLDASIKRRERLVEQLATAEPRLQEIKEQARRDGAQPGWFRGITVPDEIPPTPTPETKAVEKDTYVIK